MGLMRRLHRDRRGISAIEFAFIAPVMALVYFGCIELSMMMIADRKVTNAASSLGDLVARDTEVTNADLTDIYAAIDMIFEPSSGTEARIRVTSLYEDSGDVKVRWSDARGTGITAFSEDQTVTVPSGLIPTGGTVIMAEVQFDYESAIGFVISTKKTLTDTFYLKPRRGNEVKRNRS